MASKTIIPSALKACVRALPEPGNYFRGQNVAPPLQVSNALAFARLDRVTLQRRNFESRPHPRFVWILCLETAGSVIVDGRFLRLIPGQALLIFPYQFHSYADLERNAMTWLFITFEAGGREIPAILRQRVVEVPAQMWREIHTLVNELARSASASFSAILRSQLLAARLLLGLVESAEYHPPLPSAPPGESRDLLHRIHRALDSPGNRHPTVEALARSLGMSESRLRTRFRQRHGLSLGAYLHHRRMHEALALLRDAGNTIAAVAGDCGYGSAEAFSRAFRKHMGVNPGAYRSQLSCLT